MSSGFYKGPPTLRVLGPFQKPLLPLIFESNISLFTYFDITDIVFVEGDNALKVTFVKKTKIVALIFQKAWIII